MIIDSHSHIHIAAFDADRDAVVERATAAGVEAILTLGTNLENSKIALEAAQKYPIVYAAAGIHPSDAHLAGPDDLPAIENLIRESPKILAVGEIGLDFYWEKKHYQAQYQIFAEMLRMAERLNLPVAIHNRSAQREMQWFFQEEEFHTVDGVMHCFAGEVDDARFYLDMGLHISFTANITYPNFQYPQTLAYVPLDKVLLETDAPYMAPVGGRKKRNEPANVLEVARQLAKIHQKPFEEICRITTENARRLFNFPA